MTKEHKDRILKLLGDEHKDADDATLLSAFVEFTEAAADFNAELQGEKVSLSASVTALITERDALKTQVTELSNKQPAGTIELSAATKATHSENTLLKLESLATKQGWSVAALSNVKTKLAGDTICLSAGADGSVSQTVPVSVLLDVLAEQPVKGLETGDASQRQNLSRQGSDDPAAQPKAGNPLLDVANATSGK